MLRPSFPRLNFSNTDFAWSGKRFHNVLTPRDTERDEAWLRHAVLALSWDGLSIDRSSWTAVAVLTDRVADIDIAREFLAAAEAHAWPFDSPAFAAVARICANHRLREQFGCAIAGCQSAHWPLNEDGWTTFLLACNKLNVRALTDEVLAACDAGGWRIDQTAWPAWIRLTELRGEESTQRAVGRLLEEIPSLPAMTLSLVLKALRDVKATADETRRVRLTAIARAITSTRPTSDWTHHGNLAHMMRIARRSRDRDLMTSILLAAEPETLSVNSINNVIAFTLAYFTIMGETIAAARTSATLLVTVHPVYSSDEKSRTRVALLYHVLAEIAGLPPGDGALQLPKRVEDLGFDITARDLKIVAAAVDQTSLVALLSKPDQFMRRLSNTDRIEGRHKLRALFRVLGDVAANSIALIQLGQIYRSEHDYDGALELFAHAEDVAETKKIRSIAAYEMGVTLLDQGKARQALPLLQRSTEVSPAPFPAALVKAAEAAKRSGEYVVATDILQTLIESLSNTSESPDLVSARPMLQLGNTIIAGVRESKLAASELRRAAELAASFFNEEVAHEDRTLREAALLAVECLELEGVLSGPLSPRHPVLLLLGSDTRPAVVTMLCEAVTEHRAWSEPILDTLLNRLLRGADQIATRRSLIRCLSAALVTGYHRGTLAGKQYIKAVARIFRRLIRSGTLDRATLLFELFLARRALTLRLVLEHYSAMAERILAVFFMPDLGAGRRSKLRDALTDINNLLAEELPANLKPAGYGHSDVAPLAPRLSQFASRLDVRATMRADRGIITFREGPNDARASCLQLEWLRLRAEIESLIPLAAGSPFRSVARLSVPWYVDLQCEASAVVVELRFPSEIHPQHEPANILQHALASVDDWVENAVGHGCRVSLDLSNWKESRIVTVHFPLTVPENQSTLETALEPFTEFMASETRRFLSRGSRLATFYADARDLFDQCSQRLLLQGDGWLALYHQHFMDVQFVTTAEWLFIGESLAETREKPEYHPRYEVHSLKTHVANAMADIDRFGEIQQRTLDDLRVRLVTMRQNIFEALRRVSGDAAGNPKAAIDVVGVVNEAISKLTKLHNSPVNIAVTGPFYALATADAPSLQAALSNALLNAVEAVAADPPADLITVAVTAEDPEWLSITISNPFDAATPPKPHGFGLGLADTRFHVETVNGGRLEAGPTDDGWYRLRIHLRRWLRAA